MEDVISCWKDKLLTNVINDSSSKKAKDLLTLSETQAYEVLCDILSYHCNNTTNNLNTTIYPLITANTTINISSNEDLKYLNQQFELLSLGKPIISYNTFIAWSEIQALLADEYCTIDDIKNLWINTCNSLKTPIDLNQFILLNKEIDELVDIDDELDDDIDSKLDNKVSNKDFDIPIDEEMSKAMKNELDNEIDILDSEIDIEINDVINQEIANEALDSNILGLVTEIESIDPWDLTINPLKIFNEDFILYLKKYFHSNCKSNDLLYYDTFANWVDIQQMLREGQVDSSCLKDLWLETINQQNKLINKSFHNYTLKDIKSMGITYDMFIRMNIRLDLLMDEIEEALATLTDKDIENYYRKEFNTLTNNQSILTYKQLLKWQDINELLDNGDVTKEDIDRIWDAIPKQPTTLSTNKQTINMNDSSNKTKKRRVAKIESSEGITIDGFLAFNNALEDII